MKRRDGLAMGRIAAAPTYIPRRCPSRANRAGLCLGLTLAVLLGGWPSASTAVSPLALDDCVSLALRQNLQHLNDLQSLERSRASLQMARSPFELNAEAQLTAPSFTEEQDTKETIALTTRFREESTTYQYGGNLSVYQRVPHLGRFYITSSGSRYEITSNRRADFVDFSGDIRFGWSHDLLTTPREELQLRRSELSLTNAHTTLHRRELSLDSRVTNAYYGLVQSIRQLEIQRQRLEQSEAALDLARRKFEIGLIAEVQALGLEVEKLRAEASYAQAETAIEQRRDALRELLGMRMEEPLEVVTEVPYEKLPIDEERAVELGLRNRTDMQEAEIQAQMSGLDLTEQRERLGPSAQLNTSVRLGGRGPEIADVSNAFERKLISASIDLQLPVLDGGQRRGQIRQAEIAMRQSSLSRDQQRQAIIREIRNAVRNTHESERQIELRQAALQVAERKFDVERSRFELGLADSQELLVAQTDLTSERTNALTAFIDYQLSLKALHMATMTDLSELSATAAQ